MLVFEAKGKPEYPEKTSWNQDEYQQQTQPTYDAESGNQTRATLVAGVCYRHPCSAVPPPSPPPPQKKVLSPRQSAGGHPKTSRYCRGRSTAKKPTYTGHTIEEFCRPSTKKAPSQMAYTTDVISQRTAMFITIMTRQT